MAFDHEGYMRRAISLARRNPDAPFGCVIVDRQTEEVLAEGVNDAERSPVLHGETAAIINLFDSRPNADPTNLILYTTAEPCPMCSGAILWSEIPEVVYGTSIQTLKRLELPQIDLRCEEVSSRASWPGFVTTGGVLEKECDALFEEVVRRQKGNGGSQV